VSLINDVNLVTALDWSVKSFVTKIASIINQAMGCGIQLHDIQ
jgi:hypothetical protein